MMEMMPDGYDDWKLMGPDEDYDYNNYECQCCGAFDEDLTEDLCIVCYEEQQEAEEVENLVRYSRSMRATTNRAALDKQDTP